MHRLSIHKKSLAEASDDELLLYYQQTEDNRYIGELYQRNAHLIFGACLKYLEDKEESKDAVMTIFEKIMTKPLTGKVQNFNTWIYSVIKNECMTRLRKRKSSAKQQENLNFLENNEAKFMENEGVMRLSNEGNEKSRATKLAEALNQLSPEQKQCIELFFYKDQSYHQIAETTQLPLKQVKSHLQNGKRLLKRYLERR